MSKTVLLTVHLEDLNTESMPLLDLKAMLNQPDNYLNKQSEALRQLLDLGFQRVDAIKGPVVLGMTEEKFETFLDNGGQDLIYKLDENNFVSFDYMVINPLS